MSTAAKDVVGIFDNATFAQVFEKARAIKAKVNEVATVMSHPAEDGSSVVDHKVVLPIEIELSMVLSTSDYVDVYKSFKTAFLASTLLIVQTRSGVYRNMVIASMPHDEDPEFYEAITLAVKLKEVKFATYITGEKVTVKPTAKKDANKSKTVNSGKQQATTAAAPAKKKSVLAGWLS